MHLLFWDNQTGAEETVQMYAERLFALAQEAFARQQGGLGAVESQMISFFVDGLYHEILKMKLNVW